MKKRYPFLLCLLTSVLLISPAKAQNYDINKLKIIADIWGEVYLFHPSVMRTDKEVRWEQELISFLPSIKREITEDEFIQTVNNKLLSILDDRFTRIQKIEGEIPYYNTIQNNKEFDYIRFNESQLSNIGSLITIDSSITDQNSQKPLVIDIRINKKLNTDYHTNTFFDYFISMFLSEPLMLSQQISREHFGWDEWNDWWFYEQRWKINEQDRQLSDCNQLKPFTSYTEELYQYLPEFNFTDFITIKRPLYLITNNSFLSYYENLISNLVVQKSNIHVLNEDSGTIFTPLNSGLKSYPLSASYNFILNTSFYLTNGQSAIPSYRNYAKIDSSLVVKSLYMDSTPPKPITVSLTISPKKYKSSSPTLSAEEKILGIIKIRTILKHFHRDNQLHANYLDQAFEKYTALALITKTDKAYYELISEMLAPLNDSHISIFHPSIIDFSAMFIVPINFGWIQNQMVITAVNDSITGCQVGDVISAIDNIPVNQILETSQKQISHSNRQSLLATVINPGNFAGQQGSTLTVNINDKNIVLSRTTPIWELINSSGNRKSRIYDGNIGYLNLSLTYAPKDIKAELKKMQNTKGLIIDLRNSYPTYDFDEFLSMLCPYPVTTRIAEVPIVTASDEEIICIQRNHCSPDPNFTYKGKIAVLIDKTMISRPEDIAIALAAFPNVVFIGEQTQGTDGETSKIHMPGNGEIAFTGQRIKFGNGKDFYGTGISPDIVVKNTIDGVKSNRDEILECALKYMTEK